ncbi:MAG: hypothetical protein ABIP75_17970 [Pyrinomonadaceae bacterium]
MKKYRRIEISAYRRHVTIVSGEWSRDDFQIHPVQIVDGVKLSDSDSTDTVTPESPAGQLIIAEAMRSLERRLLPGVGQDRFPEDRSENQTRVIGPGGKLRSVLRSIRRKIFGTATETQ